MGYGLKYLIALSDCGKHSRNRYGHHKNVLSCISCVQIVMSLSLILITTSMTTTIGAMTTLPTNTTGRVDWMMKDIVAGNSFFGRMRRGDNVTDAPYPDFGNFFTTESPSQLPVHVLGIIHSDSSPTLEETNKIMELVEGYNFSMKAADLTNYNPDDAYSFKKAVKTLKALKPQAVIGPYSWPYAVATEHMRIPYFVTSMTSLEQPETPFLIQLFPDAHVFARAVEDMVIFYALKRVVVFHDSEQGQIILERLAQQSWLETTGYFINNKTMSSVRERLKVMRDQYFTSFILILDTDNTRSLLDEGLSLSMFSPPHKWLLINMGLIEYNLEQYVDSHANITVLRLMMDYKSQSCSLGTNFINLKRASTHDALRLYVLMYEAQARRQEEEDSHKLNMRRTVRQLKMDGCTGHLIFSKFGKRTENFLQIMTLQGYMSGSKDPADEEASYNIFLERQQITPVKKTQWCEHLSGTWRSRPDDIRQRVEPSKSYSTVTSVTGNVFGDKPLRITVILEKPFVQKKNDKSLDTGHPVYEGFCIDIVLEMAKILNFQYNISEAPDGKFGSLKPPPRGWTGMVRQLVDDKADIAAAPFQMSTQRAEVVDFTKPFMTKGTTVVVKKPDQKIGMFQFLSPLSKIVWSAIFVAFVGTSLMLFAVSRVNSDRQAKYTHNLRESFWYIWGTLLRGSLSGSPHAISSRIVSSAWWFFCLILSSIYTANLAAFLTITISDVGINTAQDLAIQEDFDYGTVEGSQTELFFKHTRMNYYERMWAHMSVLSPKSMSRTVEIGFDRVRKGKYAFIWDSPTIRDRISNDCDLMEIGSPFDLKGYGFAYQKNAPYGEKLSMALLQLQDEGVLYRLERKWWRPQLCPNHKQSAQTKSLDLETVAGMYVIILCGAVISTLLCLLQYFFSGLRRKRKFRLGKDKTDESKQDSDADFRPQNSTHKISDGAEPQSEINHDKITYANHSPLQFRSVEDWT